MFCFGPQGDEPNKNTHMDLPEVGKKCRIKQNVDY